MKNLLCLTASLAVSSLAAVAAAEPASPWVPAASVEIAHSSGKFDFLRIDSKRNRLLAAHENDGTADYIDLQKNTVIARLKVGGAVDTAIDTGSKFYYVSVQEAERVAVVDAETLKEVKSIKTPGPTDAIIFEPKNHMIYVTHDNGADVWVIDPVSAKVVGTISIPGVPEFMVYDDKADRIYLNIKTKDVVAVIDPSTNKVIAQWPTAPATQPHGLALDAVKHRLFAAGGNGKMVMIDTESGSATGSVDIVPKVDQIAFDIVGELVYCAGADKLSVVSTAGGKLASVGDVTTAATAKNVAVDPATRSVWTTYTDGKSSYAKSWAPPRP
ncbi:MAG TPA: YncE family protein [Steroidobacteraceae bacterium]|nr:YncE family protein [Steroidobacteraceae bacterium]